MATAENSKWIVNGNAKKEISDEALRFLGEEEIAAVRDFHRTFPQYRPTPLRSLAALARFAGVGAIYVKDESYRFGLNSFKVLGASYAIGRYLAKRLELEPRGLSFDMLRSEEVRRRLGEVTFASTTDGNHGRGVAWTAQQLGQKAVIYMPQGSSLTRLEHILATGAEGYITDLNYDDTVRQTTAYAKEHGWVIIQDTAWEGYTEIPAWIMQGYGVLAHEALEQLDKLGAAEPTHVFIQAGVGSLAGAVLGYFAARFKEKRPVCVVVEPDKADCFYRSALAGDGKPRNVTGEMNTIMAGLACGEPNPFAWKILWERGDLFVSCPDQVAARGMRVLGNPLGDDARVVSGESGAVTTGLLLEILQNEKMQEVRQLLKLDGEARVLLISTEGDTDPQMYRKIVWNGDYPS